jgi:hypothetical protein
VVSVGRLQVHRLDLPGGDQGDKGHGRDFVKVLDTPGLLHCVAFSVLIKRIVHLTCFFGRVHSLLATIPNSRDVCCKRRSGLGG